MPNRPRYPLRSPYQPPTGLLFVATPGLDRSLGCGLLFVGGAERYPVALRGQPGAQVVDRAEVVHQLGRSDLADERGRVGALVAVHRVLAGSGCGLQHPRIVFGSLRHRALLWLSRRSGPTSSTLAPTSASRTPPPRDALRADRVARRRAVLPFAAPFALPAVAACRGCAFAASFCPCVRRLRRRDLRIARAVRGATADDADELVHPRVLPTPAARRARPRRDPHPPAAWRRRRDGAAPWRRTAARRRSPRRRRPGA